GEPEVLAPDEAEERARRGRLPGADLGGAPAAGLAAGQVDHDAPMARASHAEEEPARAELDVVGVGAEREDVGGLGKRGRGHGPRAYGTGDPRGDGGAATWGGRRGPGRRAGRAGAFRGLRAARGPPGSPRPRVAPRSTAGRARAPGARRAAGRRRPPARTGRALDPRGPRVRRGARATPSRGPGPPPARPRAAPAPAPPRARGRARPRGARTSCARGDRP